MENLKKLIKVTKDFNLIESTSDIDALFLDFKYNEEEPLNNLIQKALKWGYLNDELEDFFLEHWDVLVDTEIVKGIQYCDIKTQGYLTNFSLYRIHSKNKYYYKIDGYGSDEDLIDTYGFYAIEENEDDKGQIESFQFVCDEAYTCNGEFTVEHCIEHGSTIEFSDGL
jgi:hypothetical protein